MSVLMENNLSVSSTVASSTGRRNFSAAANREQIHASGSDEHIGFSLHFRLNPATVLVSVPFLAVGVTALIGYVVTMSFGISFYFREMLAAGIVAIVGGILSGLPVALSWRKDALKIAQMSLLGMALRVGTILAGTFLALGPGWALAKMPLTYWTLGMYFPLLAAETAVMAYISNRCDRQ